LRYPSRTGHSPLNNTAPKGSPCLPTLIAGQRQPRLDRQAINLTPDQSPRKLCGRGPQCRKTAPHRYRRHYPYWHRSCHHMSGTRSFDTRRHGCSKRHGATRSVQSRPQIRSISRDSGLENHPHEIARSSSRLSVLRLASYWWGLSINGDTTRHQQTSPVL